MLDRTSALIQWGRYYTGEGIETGIPFAAAAAEYRKQIKAGTASKEIVQQAAEFLFFSGRIDQLRELEPFITKKSLQTEASVFAFCAYAWAGTDMSRAVELLSRGINTYPDDPELANDLLRFKLIRGARVLPELSEETDISSGAESFAGLRSSIYLIFYLAENNLLESLPPEIEAAVQELKRIAANDAERREALLIEADYAGMRENDAVELQVITAALEQFPEDFDVLSAAARLGTQNLSLHRAGDQDRVLEYADKLRNLRPWHPGGYSLYGTLMLLLSAEEFSSFRKTSPSGLLRDGIEAFEQSVGIEALDQRSWEELFFALASLYKLIEEPSEIEDIQARTREHLSRLPAELTAEPGFLAEAGKTIFESGMEHEGDSVIRQAVELAPFDPGVMHASGTVSFIRGLRSDNTHERQELLYAAAQAFRQAWKAGEDPFEKGRYLITLASVYNELGETEQELEVLTEGLREELPDDEIYLRISELLHRKGDIYSAVKALELGFKLLPASADLGIETARCYSRDGRFKEALEILDKLLERYPNTPWIWNQAGIIYIEKGNNLNNAEERQTAYETAARSYDQAHRMAPEEYTYLGNYGDALRLCGNLEASQHFLKKAMELNKSDAFSLNSLGLVYSEMAKNEASREKQEELILEAERYFDRAADCDPGNPVFLINLADLYYDLGFFEETIDMYQRIIESDEDPWQYYDIIGLCYYHTGHLEEAIHWFSLAMEKEPQAPEVVNSLGLCFFGAGRINEAIEYFKQASLLDPENPVYLDNIAMAQYNQIGYSADPGDYPGM
ncbi:tetratricopeptide repeat protein [Marispirochaeta sp.]|uniref:tetratricopeptide repeat protein n=1 Tax=Marispirochaeta sp. TaxID=2038653 RepID=UPI0029C7D6BC|nr:tetratricopeptide repeat protein [Marispirochaeta sp.]